MYIQRWLQAATITLDGMVHEQVVDDNYLGRSTTTILAG
jgi:hypothetical protein